MNNKTSGTVLLCAAGFLTTIDLAAAKLSNAIILGMIYLGGNGGSAPKNPTFEIEVFIMVLILTFLGIYFLYNNEEPT